MIITYMAVIHLRGRLIAKDRPESPSHRTAGGAPTPVNGPCHRSGGVRSRAAGPRPGPSGAMVLDPWCPSRTCLMRLKASSNHGTADGTEGSRPDDPFQAPPQESCKDPRKPSRPPCPSDPDGDIIRRYLLSELLYSPTLSHPHGADEISPGGVRFQGPDHRRLLFRR